MKNRSYISLTITRAVLLLVLVLSPVAGILADVRCDEDCNDHSHMKKSIAKCCHSVNVGISVRTSQECADDLTFSVGEYAQPIKTKSVKNILYSIKNSFRFEEASPKFRNENELSANFLSISAPALYLLDSAFLI